MKCRKLDVWKRSCKICSEVYRYFRDFKDFGFKDQITRSSLSVPSNIAEGLEKISDKDTIKYLDIARGSLAEIQTQIYIGIDIGYIQKDVGFQWVNEYEKISKMITGLIRSMRGSRGSGGSR